MKRPVAMDSHHEQALPPPTPTTKSLKIHVKVMKTFTLNVNCSDTVDQIKSKLSAIEGIDKSKQEMFFDGMHLKNENKIADYNIMTNSSVDLYVTDGIQISVNIPSVGKTIKLNARKSSTVADVKAEITQKEEILMDDQILMYADQQLEDNRMLSQCDLTNDQTFDVLVRQVLTRMQSGVGIALRDSQMLQDQHIRNNYTLLPWGNIQFFIKTWEGKTLTMVLKKWDTGKEIMDRLEEKLRIKGSLYFLCHRGHVLLPEDTLCGHEVESNSTIYIRLRNSGVVKPNEEALGSYYYQLP